MRWRWRKHSTPPTQDSDQCKSQEAENSLRQAEVALNKVRDQKVNGSLIARTLADIRKENHFREIWNDGIQS